MNRNTFLRKIVKYSKESFIHDAPAFGYMNKSIKRNRIIYTLECGHTITVYHERANRKSAICEFCMEDAGEWFRHN